MKLLVCVLTASTIRLLVQAEWRRLFPLKTCQIDKTFQNHLLAVYSHISEETLKNSQGKLLMINLEETSNSNNLTVNLTLHSSEVSFPNIVHPESHPRSRVWATSKKYAYVVRPYWEQTTQNIRSFLALVIQGSFSGRRVVAPMVKNSKFQSSGYPIDYYFDRKYLRDVLESQGHLDIVDPEEFHKECSPNDPHYTTVHFLYAVKKAELSTKKIYELDDETYSKISLEARTKGWTNCSFIRKLTKQSPRSKMFCVDTTIVTDWKIFERDVIKSPKCLSIVIWRGVGDTYRARFIETRLAYSSLDLSLSLKPSPVVMEQVEKFKRKFLASKYIGVQIRGEHVAIDHGLAGLEQCIHLLGYVLRLVKKLFDVDKVFVATDMSKFGSSSWKRSVKRDKITKKTLPRLQNLVLSVTNGVTFEQAADNDVPIDRGVVALIEMSLVFQAQRLLTIGHGSFHRFVTSKFLEFHRKEPPATWSLIKLCFA